MSLLVAILILALLALVVLVVSAPLRPPRGDLERAPGVAPSTPKEPVAPQARAVEHDELESAREAKYREIRDAEMDFRTGKLSRADYEAIDAQLRAEALEILDRLQAAEARPELRPRDA